MYKKLLIVDDERLILKALERLFRLSSYSVYTADNANDALEIISKETIGVLLSDFTMPNMTGASLLAEAKIIRPEMTRIILSGNSDQHAVIQSINEGAAHRYLSKPWDDELLLEEIESAFDMHQAMQLDGASPHLLTLKALAERISHIHSNSLEKYIALTFTAKSASLPLETIDLSCMQTDVFNQIASTPFLNKDEYALGVSGEKTYCLYFPVGENLDASLTAITQHFPDRAISNGLTIPLTLHSGYAYSSNESTPDQLIRESKLALQEAVRLNELKPIQYTTTRQLQHNRRVAVASHLYNALTDNELSLHYQPKIDATTHELTGAEALVRWQNSELGSISPAEFIPICESNGQIVPIGSWVLSQAIEQWQQWFKHSHCPPRISVNVSAVQLNDDSFLPTIKHIISTSSIDPTRLELELTETCLVHGTENAKRVLSELKSLGFHLSIDDFGTGFSSLSYLSHFPVDTIKIDRSFVIDMLSSKKSENLIKNIIAIAKDLDKETVAEGVETEAQLDKLKSLGCDVIQGYYFSKPLPAPIFQSKYSTVISNCQLRECDKNSFRLAGNQ